MNFSSKMTAFAVLMGIMVSTWALKARAENIPANAAPPSSNVMANVMKNMSPEQQARIQSMALQMSAQIQKQTEGDPEKAQKLLQQYMANPALFYQQMSPEHKTQVELLTKEVAGKVKPADVAH